MSLPLTRLPAKPEAPADATAQPTPEAAQPPPTPITPALRAEIARLRTLVASCLRSLSKQLDKHFGPAIANARKAWEQADDLVVVDPPLAASIAETRRALHRAAHAPHPAVRAVAFECLLALDSACGLTGLAERRLSSLIRLRVRSDDPELLPEGRPFIDLARALAEAAREWS